MTGIVRRVDVLGRIVVPKEIRKILRINEGDPLEIYAIKNSVVLKRYSPLTDRDGVCEDISAALCRQTGKSVFICDKQTFISASGFISNEILGLPISSQIENLIRENKTLICSYNEGQDPLPLTNEGNHGFTNQLVVPISGDEDVFGAIIVTDRIKENNINNKDIELTMLASEVLARRKS